MKKSSIAKLVLFTIFLTTFIFNSIAAHSFFITINKDKTYNLLLPPIPHEGLKRVVIRVQNNNNKHDLKFFGRCVVTGKEIILENFKLNTTYILTTTFYTEENQSIQGDSALVFITNFEPDTKKYNFEYILFSGIGKNEQTINPNIKDPSKKIPI